MASPEEQQEIEELNQLISSSSGSIRESPITAAKYNRWLVGEQNRGAGSVVRREVDHLNNARQDFHTRHKEYGQSLKEAGNEQMRRDHEKVEMMRQQNLAKGAMVKAEVIAQKAQEQKQKEEWMAHGRTLGARAQMQKQRIRDVVGEGSKRVAEMAAKTKQEELDYERELAGVRSKLLQDNKSEVEKVRNETADEVIDASKEFAFEQRKSLAFTTKAAEAAWKDERNVNTKNFLAKAHANKADAQASRAKAKELREEIEATRREVANVARKQQQSNKEQKDKIIMFASGGIKDTHDQIYRKKYVPTDAANKLQNSKYAGSVA
uniref:Uncharacterized protein n=1 Tax=Haptolina brevifila TaxID=156173 RepID=A0A7S2HSP6_9EUKA|mmetsp:Transcript_57425/g.113984  ORF Transcript_57425/g.113984 Transcript_57425/m.113984 type:complete len:322 (+) Transcript_57425:93-1058(+)|eukprot:CAMPEP_0174719992 /NCGR_PEP_ID=MMETSP1094-20130205/32517_1 /TAXON_ID=156173 /ORGANISM="Chrysochromulina brevifilum, Strain UTEX LB 985" /LENGTH=321 /DNA_ID=CAMNT_0015920407 /DNA_START=88 /DNA_END=1053 /DNA_ORIENTATION=+